MVHHGAGRALRAAASLISASLWPGRGAGVRRQFLSGDAGSSLGAMIDGEWESLGTACWSPCPGVPPGTD